MPQKDTVGRLPVDPQAKLCRHVHLRQGDPGAGKDLSGCPVLNRVLKGEADVEQDCLAS